MKLSFPYMGPQLYYKKLLESFGHELILPPRPTKKTIDLGVKNSPEFACFPYKVLMGTYIEALELGADTIVTSGGSGPCRAGLYCDVHEKTLKSMGYDVHFIVFDDFNRDRRLFMDNFKKIKGQKSWLTTCKNMLVCYELIQAVDRLQKIMECKRAYELKKGSFNTVFKEIQLMFDSDILSVSSVHKLFKKGREMLEAVPCRNLPDDDQRIKIGIVGEIYVVMEPSINMNIAEVLNNLGCEVMRSMYISDWLDHALCPKIFSEKSGQYLVDKSRKYLELGIGGHECHNIGNIITYKEQGYDGIIHLMPFACLPELVTQSLLPQISDDYHIPAISLSLDEQTGIANNLTRIEAFVELLRKNKNTRLRV